MHSTPQPKHEHLTADKTHQEDTPSTATTSHPMALYSKIELDQPTTSITNTFAKINMSPTQSPTQQTDEATTDQPTTKTLPIELWMRVFEHVDNTKHYARPPVVEVYKSSLAVYGDTITAAQTLPAFEKRSWKQSRAFYHIDRTSRAAALKLNFCLRMLEESRAPSLAMRSAAKVTRLLRQGRVPEVQPEYLVIKVSEEAEVLRAYREAGRVLDSLSGVSDGVVLHSLGLGTAKHIVLLERCNWNTFSMLARSREIELAIYEFWRRDGIPTGVVEIA